MAFNAVPSQHLSFLFTQRIAGTWSQPRPLYDGFSSELATDASGRLLTVFTMGDPTGAISGRDINSIFFASSEDIGATWSTPTRILRAGLLRAHYPRIIQGGDDRIHVIWQRDTDGDLYPDMLEHSHSLDGICWSDPVALPAEPAGIPTHMDLIADGAGGLHLVINQLVGGVPPDRTRAIYFYWDGTAWTDSQPLFGIDDVWEISMARDPGNLFHLAIRADINGLPGVYYTTGRIGTTP
jgi:hypothetical protein